MMDIYHYVPTPFNRLHAETTGRTVHVVTRTL